MQMRKLQRMIALLVLVLSMSFFGSCASSHVIQWCQGQDSLFEQPGEADAAFLRPAGAVLSLPVALVWDLGMLPFQWVFDIYPFGSAMEPQPPDERNR